MRLAHANNPHLRFRVAHAVWIFLNGSDQTRPTVVVNAQAAAM